MPNQRKIHVLVARRHEIGRRAKPAHRPCPGLLLAGLLVTALGGCGGGSPSRVEPLQIAPDAAEKAMELYDADKDGFLDQRELEKVPGLKAALKQVDTNGDGKISADEIKARITSWKESKVGRLGVHCRVRIHGKPLVGATVTFVPEGFLGGNLRSANGTTDARGRCALREVGGEGMAGVSPGFYRVQITKDGQNIPAKYNTETTLGQEVGRDAAGNEGAIKFDLDY